MFLPTWMQWRFFVEYAEGTGFLSVGIMQMRQKIFKTMHICCSNVGNSELPKLHPSSKTTVHTGASSLLDLQPIQYLSALEDRTGIRLMTALHMPD